MHDYAPGWERLVGGCGGRGRSACPVARSWNPDGVIGPPGIHDLPGGFRDAPSGEYLHAPSSMNMHRCPGPGASELDPGQGSDGDHDLPRSQSSKSGTRHEMRRPKIRICDGVTRLGCRGPAVRGASSAGRVVCGGDRGGRDNGVVPPQVRPADRDLPGRVPHIGRSIPRHEHIGPIGPIGSAGAHRTGRNGQYILVCSLSQTESSKIASRRAVRIPCSSAGEFGGQAGREHLGLDIGDVFAHLVD